MKHQCTLLAMALTLFANTAWAAAEGDPYSDDFKKFEVGDQISLNDFDPDIEEREATHGIAVERCVWTQLPQRLMEFRQEEGRFYRLYARLDVDRPFVRQSGLWKLESDGAKWMPREYCRKIIQEWLID